MLGSRGSMSGYLLSACSGLFGCLIIPWFQTPGVSCKGGCLCVCLCWGGCLGFISQISSLGFSVFPSDRRLLHQKGFFHHSEFIHSECIDSIHLDQGGHLLDFSPFPLAEGERHGNQIFILDPSNLTQMPQVYQGLSKPF